MSGLDLIRLRGTVIAISVFFAIVSLYVIIDQRPARPVSLAAPSTTTTTLRAAATTIPIDNRLCGLAQRVLASLPKDQPGITQSMQAFYTEAATFTEGDVRGDLTAAGRFYKEVNDIAVKANWDVNQIVRNNDGARWKALLTGTPTGVPESRQEIRDICRVTLPDPPSIEVDANGFIRDPRLAKLLEQVDKELTEPATTTTTIPPATVPTPPPTAPTPPTAPPPSTPPR